jgi:hypothetical protein
MEKELKDYTFQELVDQFYGVLIMSLASANAPKSVMWRAMDTAIRWRIERDVESGLLRRR